MLETGSVLDGKYKILNEIGRGGMSVVYLAINERANKTWAVKEVRKDGGRDSGIVIQNIAAETEMLKKLRHPHLPAIVDVIDGEDSLLIVMDYIEGRSLQDLVDIRGPQESEKVIEWAKQLCDVLGYLHSRQPPVIYRDLKPANVMLRPSGDITLIDFGTAREYKSAGRNDTEYLGTRGYAAPEQFGAYGQTDARTDIYTLGATMFHLVTGCSPAEMNYEIPPTGDLVPRLKGSGLEKIIAGCCRADPAERWQDCEELLYALQHVHEEDDRERARRRRKLSVFAACLILSLSAAVSGLGFRVAFANTRAEQYARIMRTALAEMDADAKMEELREAMDLAPERAEAYAALIGSLEGMPEDEFERSYETVRDCVSSRRHDPSRRRQNIEYLRERNPGAYSDFNFRLGMLVYLNCPGGKDNAGALLEDAIAAGGLDEGRREAAELLAKLSDLSRRKKSGAGAPGKKIEFEHLYADCWGILEELALRLETLGSRTNIGYPVRICGETAYEISHNCALYRNDSVPEETVRKTLDRAETFMRGVNSSSLEQQGEIERVRSELKKAIDAVRDCYPDTYSYMLWEE